MSKNVKLVKLSGGEEVVFEAGEETITSIEMIQPLVLHVVPQGKESYGLALIPYSPANPDGPHTLYRAHIVSSSQVSENLKNAYIQRTTGIEIASAFDAFTQLK